MEWLIREYMAKRHIKSDKELIQRTGYAHSTFYKRINHPEQLRISELAALDKVLQFSAEDLAKLVRGK